MQQNTLDISLFEATATDRKSLGEQILAVWKRLRLLYRRTDGPHIFASYYAGAYDRVSASEPQASFKKFVG